MTTRIVAVAALGLLCHANAVSDQDNSGACAKILEPANGRPVFGGGWVGQVAANKLNSPRGIILDNNGNLLVVEKSRGIRRITWKDDGGVCVNVDKSESLVQMSEVGDPFIHASGMRVASGPHAFVVLISQSLAVEPWHRAFRGRQDAVCFNCRCRVLLELRCRRRNRQ